MLEVSCSDRNSGFVGLTCAYALILASCFVDFRFFFSFSFGVLHLCLNFPVDLNQFIVCLKLASQPGSLHFVKKKIAKAAIKKGISSNISCEEKTCLIC